MKLKEERPDRQGYWWCWKEGFNPVLNFLWFSCDMWMIELTKGDNCFNIHIEETGYTHFAGPIEQPDIPVPSRIQMFGELSCQIGSAVVAEGVVQLHG